MGSPLPGLGWSLAPFQLMHSHSWVLGSGREDGLWSQHVPVLSSSCLKESPSLKPSEGILGVRLGSGWRRRVLVGRTQTRDRATSWPVAAPSLLLPPFLRWPFGFPFSPLCEQDTRGRVPTHRHRAREAKLRSLRWASLGSLKAFEMASGCQPCCVQWVPLGLELVCSNLLAFLDTVLQIHFA